MALVSMRQLLDHAAEHDPAQLNMFDPNSGPVEAVAENFEPEEQENTSHAG